MCKWKFCPHFLSFDMRESKRDYISNGKQFCHEIKTKRGGYWGSSTDVNSFLLSERYPAGGGGV